MFRFLFFALMFLSAALGRPEAARADDLPARPAPFRFVNDQAQLLSAAEVKSLENGLRHYADSTGTQVVVVTVPSLGGRPVADYARALGESWGIGQRDKDNGVVVLLGAQEHKVSIQAGQGLQSVVTPALVSRIINQQMTPSFKQGRYFLGLRQGLNLLLEAANPYARSKQDVRTAAATAAPTQATTAASSAVAPEPDLNATSAAAAPASEPYSPYANQPAQTEPSGPGFGTLAIGALLIGGVIWLLVRLFRRRSAPTAAGPDFLPNQPRPNQPGGNYRPGPVGGQQGPDFLGNRSGGGMGGMGSGMGGVLMTGAAAAAGAYLGNRMASGHDTPDNNQLDHNNQPHTLDPGTAGAAGGAVAGGGFPALDDTGAANEPAPDYFSDDTAGTDSPDYFGSDDSSSYDDLSSGDTGGGGFDGGDDNSGSW